MKESNTENTTHTRREGNSLHHMFFLQRQEWNVQIDEAVLDNATLRKPGGFLPDVLEVVSLVSDCSEYRWDIRN